MSTANKQGIWSGRTDHPLAKEGQEQALLAGQKAKNLNIDLVVSSTQRRAYDTAKIMAKQIDYPIKKIMVNSLLVERDFGELETKKAYLTTVEMHKANILGFETDDMLIKRAEEAFEWLESLGGKNILVVSHGSFGRALRKVAVAEHDFLESIPNAEIVCWVEG